MKTNPATMADMQRRIEHLEAKVEGQGVLLIGLMNALTLPTLNLGLVASTLTDSPHRRSRGVNLELSNWLAALIALDPSDEPEGQSAHADKP